MNVAHASPILRRCLWAAPVGAFICTAASWMHFFWSGGLRLEWTAVLVRTCIIAVFGLVLLSICCVGAYRTVSRQDLPRILTCALLIHCCMLLALPLFSTDLFTYLAYGELAARGMDPHSVGPGALINSPIIPLSNWANTPSAYGPAADKLMAIAGNVGVWFRSPIWASGICYKLMAGALDIWSLYIMYALARESPKLERTRGFVLFAMNPLLAWEVAGQGHNDGLVVLAGAAFIWCTLHRREAYAVVALTLGILSKFVLAPILALHFWRVLRSNWRLAAKLVPVVLLTAALVYAPHWSKASILNPWLRPLHQDDLFRQGTSLYTLFWKVWRWAHHGLPPSPVTYTVYAWTGRLLLIAVAMFCVRRTRSARDVIFSALVLFVSVLSTTAVVAPWYFTWLLPFACMQDDHRWQNLVLGLTLVAAPSLGISKLWVVLPVCQLAGIFAVLRWSWSGLGSESPELGSMESSDA